MKPSTALKIGLREPSVDERLPHASLHKGELGVIPQDIDKRGEDLPRSNINLWGAHDHRRNVKLGAPIVQDGDDMLEVHHVVGKLGGTIVRTQETR
jgi:hypothetical protein